MDPTLVLSRLAQSAVTATIKRLFARDGPGAGLVDRSAVPVRRLVRWQGEPLALRERELHGLAAELVHRAVDGGGERPIPADEDLAVTDALARTLGVLGDIEMSDVQAVGLRPQGFAQELKARAPDADRELSGSAALLYDLLVDVASVHILEFFTRRSTFEASTLVAQGRTLAELERKYSVLVERIPAPGDADAAFEARYLRDVALLHNHLTIFGIDLPHSPDSWPLDAAYLGLKCEVGGADDAPVPAELALAGRSRILVRGVAGSGKTTLVQWLAVCAAKGEFPERLAALASRVPFVLPMRRFAQDGFPAPGDFLSAVGYPGADAQPPGWVDRVLSGGRALLLVDGIDEAPESEREQLRRRLRAWTELYPGNVWLVTTRPSAVRDDWLAGEGFGELLLSPMSRDEITQFVRRWHEAARRQPSADTARLDRYEQSLLSAVRITRELGRLATNPLMCGLLCALHRDRRGYLPSGRKELYDAALTMLLERRDRERDMIVPTDGIALTRQPKIQLLQKLAHWMLINNRSEMDREIAVDILAQYLPAVPEAARQGDAERIYRHLLDRTGLLREPTHGSVDFVHRTFQDYLAAEAIVQRHDFGLLLDHAHLVNWEDVVRMAMALARPDECRDLLLRMVGHQDDVSAAKKARHLKLLAAACLEHVTEIDPEVRARVQDVTQHIVHPRSPAGARSLGWIGPIVLEMLPQPATVGDDDALLLAITATSVADDMAIDFLTGLRDRGRLDIREQLAGAWRHYDTERYAQEIIAHLDRTGLYVPLSDLGEARALARIGGPSWLRITGPLVPEELAQVLPAESVGRLRLGYDGAADEAEWRAYFPNVEGAG